MLGQTIEAKSPLSKGTIFWLLLAVASGVAGLATGNYHFLMAAVMPLVTGITKWRGRAADVVVTLEENGIVLFGTQHKLHYEEIQAVLIGNELLEAGASTVAPGPITVVHDQGRFFLPAQMNVSSVELGRFFVSRVPDRPQKEVPSSLASYAEEQLAKFGPEKVACIHQRAVAHQAYKKSGWSTIGKGLLISGICWFVLSIVLLTNELVPEAFTAWTGLGAVSILLGFLFWLLGYSRTKNSQHDLSKHGPACVIIGPAGLGLAQGDLQGKLRWDEIKGIKNSPAKSFGGSGTPALHLSFSGGELILLDIYDRSLLDVASLISENTRMPTS